MFYDAYPAYADMVGLTLVAPAADVVDPVLKSIVTH
jgi:hypothetical protein